MQLVKLSDFIRMKIEGGVREFEIPISLVEGEVYVNPHSLSKIRFTVADCDAVQ